jgi:hypothetical protein
MVGSDLRFAATETHSRKDASVSVSMNMSAFTGEMLKRHVLGFAEVYRTEYPSGRSLDVRQTRRR